MARTSSKLARARSLCLSTSTVQHDSEQLTHHESDEQDDREVHVELALTGENLGNVASGQPVLESSHQVRELGVGETRGGFIDNNVNASRLVGIHGSQGIRSDLLLVDANHPTNPLRGLLMGDPKLEFAGSFLVRAVQVARDNSRTRLGDRVDSDRLGICKHSWSFWML